LAQVDPYQWESEITIIQPLFGSNPTPFPTPWDKLDLTSFQATELEAMQPAYESLLQLTRKYPGLALEELLNDGGLTASQKSIDMDTRIQLLFTLHGDNIDIELLAFDLTPDSIEAGLNLINLDQTQQEQALRVLRTYQRVYGITQDIEDASTLVEAGYTSAMSVLQHTSQDFVNQELLTGDMIVERTQLIYERAKEAANQSLSAGMAAFDAINGGFSDSAVSNLSDDITNFFKKIDNVEALFGSHNSCKCKQCQSLLSPAAYFVDLMDFVEEHVQNKHFSGVQSTHDLSLSVRRGDLWELPLTCENTHQMIPYLDIVNTIIENFIAVRIHSYTGDLSDRAAIEALVYDTHLSSTTSLQSFQRPFSLATWEANTFLKHFAYKRDEIVQAWEGPTDVLTQATLGLSQEEFDLITQSNTNLVFLQTLYNIPTQIPLADLDVQYLLSAMGMSRAELGEIIQTEYVTQNGSSPVQIVGVKKTPDSIQVDQELVQGLDTSVMDRMHRFTRLWNQIPWSIRELDEVLNQLTLSSHGFDLDVAQLEAIAKMQRFQRQLSLTVEELCVFWYQIPQTPMNEDSKSLVDRLFNPTRLTSSASDMWPNGDTFLYQNNPPTAADSLKQQRMLAGLQLTDDELGLLFQGLQPAIAYSSNDIQTNIQSLSVLARHAQIAKMVDISIQELLALLTRVPNITSSPITYLATFDDVVAFIDFVEVWKQSDVDLEILAVIMDGVQAGSKWATQIAKEASTIVEQVTHEESLIFEDTVFAEIKGVTEFDSIAFVDLNPSLVERLPDQQCRLIYTYDPEQPQNHPIQLQTNLAGLETEFREILKRYDMVERLQEAIGNVWNVTAVDIWQCKNTNGVNLRTSNIFDDLHGTSGNAQNIAATMESLFPMYTAFVNTKEKINLIPYVYEVPLAFGISGSVSTTLTAQQWLYTQTFKKYVEAYEETNKTAFKDILHDFIVSGYVFPQNQASFETLAQLFNTDTYIIKGMFDQSISLGVQPLEAFQKLEKNVTLAQSMGVNAELIVAINSSLSSDLRKASDGLWSSFRAKYADEKQWERLIEPFEDRVRSAKRDGLVAYMIQRPGATFESPTDIYRYLLLDPEMGDCARSSHVLSAISSLQLYVHRCLMNLEQDTQASIHVLPSDIPEGEWEWRKNYRLWEANRKVFLYPENYIEPGLRDNKSPLFQELEAKLLQNEVNEDTVTQAYAEYMRGFEEISQLSIAGTYHETDPQRTHDRLHLFGVSNHEPGTYYYRTADNLHSQEKAETRGVSWAPWRKLDVQIPSRKVSPIVFRGRLYLFWVELVTTPSYEEISGSPRFEGYHHTMSLKYIFQRLDSSWSTPQSVELDQVIPFINGTGVIPDMKTTSGSSPTTYSTKLHAEPQKGYTLHGYEWEQVFPHVLTDLSGDQEIAVTGRGFECESAPLDMYGQSIKQPKSTGLWKDTNNQVLCKPRMTRDKMLHQNGTKLYSGTPHLHYLDRYSFASILLDDNRLSDFKGKLQSQFNIFDPMFSQRCQKRHLLTVQTQPTDSMVINRAFANAIFDFDGDIILLQDTKRIEDKAVLYRLNTSLTERMGYKLFSQGVFALLDTDFQENGLSEKALPVTLTQYVTDKTYTGTLPTEGAMGIYFQEIFFHIPFLLADHLNKQGQYKDAQRWYHTIFNPTHEEAPGIQPGDRNWRYHKFRNQTMTTLRDVLTNASTISAYKKDPFNPHAIARLRISAYQKSIVMKYIDNLLDWADALFTEDTVESLNEAMLLYVTAADILGKRPTELGECEALPESQMTYNSISKETKNGSTFLAEMEHLRKVPQPIRRPSTNTFSYTHTLTPSLWSDVNTQSTYLAPELAMEITGETTYTTDGSAVFHPDTSPEFGVYKGSSILQEANTPTLFGKGIANQLLPVFCIPTNDDWIGYWDRVEDRMYKIRHCMNIKGVQRDLPPFAPQIDPALLAQAKTAGISTSELTSVVKGSLPPYRFAFIIEKAKEYASTVQSFGAALLGAVEKRDAEELEALRLVHEKNIQLLSRNTHDLEIKLAKEAITSAQQQQTSANMRKLHYTQLIKKGLSNAEKTQTSKSIEAFGFMQASNAFQNVASIAALVPDIGFATTIEYGGTQ
ncbi:MAG TPA: hypothetical protein DCE42_09200, partial [Myxococcales bacterium]|nr:hypothetical protein [Myxococcales bacterium]